jgi:hypothetical protein
MESQIRRNGKSDKEKRKVRLGGIGGKLRGNGCKVRLEMRLQARLGREWRFRLAQGTESETRKEMVIRLERCEVLNLDSEYKER